MPFLSASPPDVELTGASQTPMPPEVRWALRCLWLSLTISLASVSFLLRGFFGKQEQSIFLLIVLFLPFVWAMFSAFLNIMIAYRKNWARIIQLGLTTAILVYQIAYLPRPTDSFAIKVVVVHGLDWIAMYFLFLSAGRHWFGRRSLSKDEK